MSPQGPLLETSALDLGYGQGAHQRCILSDLALSIHPGEFICLLGPNGAGKSTLIRSLSGLQAPLGGEIRIDGQPFESLSPRERARHISVVLTEGMPSGVMDTRMLVSLGRHPYSGWLGRLSAKDHERIDWALQSVGAQNLADRQVAELSDGERQKVSIARALAQEAKLMFLDEPTAFLDLPRRVELMALLRQLAHSQKMGLLLSTHDLDLALRYGDRIWMMDGRQFTQGYPEALALDGDLARAFSNQNLVWDVERGIFNPHRATCLDVYLRGNGPERIWTQRSLERLGYGITEDIKSAKFRIQIENTKWTLQAEKHSENFSSLSELIDWLKQFS